MVVDEKGVVDVPDVPVYTLEARDVKNARYINKKNTVLMMDVDFDGIEGPQEYVEFSIDFEQLTEDPHVVQIVEWIERNQDKIAKYKPDVDAILREVKEDIEQAYLLEIHTINEKYTQAELDSFAIQLEEAKAYLADNKADVPHLQILADVDGISIKKKANIIVKKAKEKSLKEFALLAKKQKLFADIKAVKTTLKSFEDKVRAIVW